MMNKLEFDYLIREVLRDVTKLRKAKGQNASLVDDYVTKQIDEIRLMLNKISEDYT